MTTPRSIRERAVFVDSSAFVAMLDRRDRSHEPAADAFRRLVRERRPLITSNLIVAETHALLRRSLGQSPALRWLSDLQLSVVFQHERDHDAAVALLRRYDDKTFSYTDAVSFVIMERFGIPTAFAFDVDFRQYGVSVVP